MSRICLLLVTSSAMFGLKAVRKGIRTNLEEEAGEVQAGGDKYHICTLVEAPGSLVKYGIFMKFPVKNCAIHCNVNSIITETVIDKQHDGTNAFIQARANKKNNGCACYSVTAPDEEEFLFGFTPRAQVDGSKKCDAEACWKKYLDVSIDVMTTVQRKNGMKMEDHDYPDSANHYSTEEQDGDELSANCKTSDTPDYKMIFPSSVNMKNTLLKLGDTTGLTPTEAEKVRKGAARDLKNFEKAITIEDPEDDDTEEELSADEVADEAVEPDQSKGKYSDSMPIVPTDDDAKEASIADEAVADKVVERPTCSVKCTMGQACGNFCISVLKNCHEKPGKACKVEPEEIQQVAKLAEATEKEEIPKVMEEYYGGKSDIAKCGAEADAWDRANCICSLANDREAFPRVSLREAACREYSVNAMDWAKPWSCSTKKKKGVKSCVASETIYISGGYGGASKQRSGFFGA